MDHWYTFDGSDKILSPALIFYPDRIKANIQRMLEIAGDPTRLRPHVKTYKCKPIVRMQMDAGISKFKCATLQEAQMLAEIKVPDVLVAYPLVGAACGKFIELSKAYPDTQFSCLIDHPDQIAQWSVHSEETIRVFIDLNVGMNRTGISPQDLTGLVEQMTENLDLIGWHLYDGHIRDIDPQTRRETVEEAFAFLPELLEQLDPDRQLELVFGGSISFAEHARHPERTLSPGTTLLWDQGYGSRFPDLPFEPAAILLSRIISKPGEHLICLDLGHKAVGSEMTVNPAYFPQFPDAEIRVHSEEHLVIYSKQAANARVGEIVWGIPWHICPTVALHREAQIVLDQRWQGSWPIDARHRIYS